ncbi:MAG: hypothetical protein M3142_00690 [Bacteroidota bacterium]|nr:hypothetical protein [Bacteroidota bacterium]
MTHFAQLYPEKVKALVYLESAYDYRQINQLWAADPVIISPGDADLKNISAGKEWFKKHFGFWSEAVETDTRIVNEQKDGSLRVESMPPAIMGKFIQAMTSFQPDYRSFRFSVLAFKRRPKNIHLLNQHPIP